MAIPTTGDANILDAEATNWRLIVYPLALVLILLLGGFGYYYYMQSQRELTENQARQALIQAKTPEAMLGVAGQFAGTDQATLALLGAGNASFDQRDFAGAAKAYQRVLDTPGAAPEVGESAQLGLASALEAQGKLDDAINAYLQIGQRGNKSPYAPFAYNAAARIYDQRGDKDNERKILSQLAALGGDSAFVNAAQARLKELAGPQADTMGAPPAP